MDEKAVIPPAEPSTGSKPPSEHASDALNKDVEIGPQEPATTEQKHDETDPDVVDWDGPDDVENPLNWPRWKTFSQISIISINAFLTPLASSMLAPGVPEVLNDFHTDSKAIATFMVSVYVLGYAIGPLIIAPISEMSGRLLIYHVANVGFLAFTIGCALAPDVSSLIVFRFLAGCFGVSPLTLGAGTIADTIQHASRGTAMSVWTLGPLLGPVIGPVAGGFLAASKGWRWIFWVVAIAEGVVTIAGFFLLRETYAPVLLERRAKRLRKETGNPRLRGKYSIDKSRKDLFVRSITRPAKLLFTSPICSIMCFYLAIVYGILYILFTTFTFVFEGSYHFSNSLAGLSYVPLGIGMVIGVVILGFLSDRIVAQQRVKHGVLRPEYRLLPALVGAPFIPVGAFIYGWGAQYQVQWAVPMLGELLIGAGMMTVFMCVSVYLIDAFTLYAASVSAANALLRSLFGALFPLFGLELYAAIGLGWGNSLLGFLTLALCPMPWVLVTYGERIRTRFPIKL